MANKSNTTDEMGSNVMLGDRKWFIILKYTLFAIIFLISIFGNSLVCYVVSRRMKRKTVTSYFIMNLAVADLLYTCCVPFDVYATVNKAWPYGAFVCKVLWPAQTLAITVSGFTLTALSVTRFWAVVKPLRRQITVKQSCVVNLLLWILGTATLVPYVIHLKHTSELICDEEWPTHRQRQIYTVSLFVIQYAIPLSIIITSYIKIGFELTKTTKTYNKALAKARGQEAKRVIKMLVVVTLTFAILTLPSAIMWMWLDFGKADQVFPSFWDVIEVINILDFMNCATNPVIYSFCNESFSREFRRQLGCILPSPPPSISTDNTRLINIPAAGNSSPSSSGNLQKEKEVKADEKNSRLCENKEEIV